MLSKTARSHQRDQPMCNSGPDRNSQGDILGHKNQKNSSFFGISGLFVGLSNKGMLDYDSVWSPTSPLDFRMFSAIGNPFASSPRAPQKGSRKGWGSSKLGLSIVDSLDDHEKPSGKLVSSLESGNILFGPRVIMKNPMHQNHIEPVRTPNSLPKDYPVFTRTMTKTPLRKGNSGVVFEIGYSSTSALKELGKMRSCLLDSCPSFLAMTSLSDHKGNNSMNRNPCSSNIASEVSSLSKSNDVPNAIVVSPKQGSGGVGSGDGSIDLPLSASEIELSEDYTCVISHGPNPKTTHIYGDRVLECHSGCLSCTCNHTEEQIANVPAVTQPATLYLTDNFLSFCHSCGKRLEGKDIYMYRGEKAFCSSDCRSKEILMDEGIEGALEDALGDSKSSESLEELLSESGVVFTT